MEQAIWDYLFDLRGIWFSKMQMEPMAHGRARGQRAFGWLSGA